MLLCRFPACPYCCLPYASVLPFCSLRNILLGQLSLLLKFHVLLQKRLHEISAVFCFKIIELSWAPFSFMSVMPWIKVSSPKIGCPNSVACFPNISLDLKLGHLTAAEVQAILCDHIHHQFVLPSALMIISAHLKSWSVFVSLCRRGENQPQSRSCFFLNVCRTFTYLHDFGYHFLSCTVTHLYTILLNLWEILGHQGQQRREIRGKTTSEKIDETTAVRL